MTHAPHDCGTCCEARGCEPDVFAVTHEPLEALTAIRGGSTEEEAGCRSRAEAAEAKLARIATCCRQRLDAAHLRWGILAIISSEEETRDGG